MQHLQTRPNFGVPGERYLRAFTPGDDFYEVLIEAHRDLSDDQSRLVNAQLILLLANHIGDLRVLQEALAVARAGGIASVRRTSHEAEEKFANAERDEPVVTSPT